jgi:acetyl-CoA carboxylase/biotin carboxylase 1
VRREKVLSLMDRLDSTYGSLKKDSKNAEKTVEERSQAAEKLVARESQLQSTYRQISLLYADLHE